VIKKIYERYIRSFRGLTREVWLLAILMLINRSGAMVIPFLSVYLNQKLHFDLQQVGWVMGSFGLGSLLGVYIGGILTDRIGYYKVQFWSLMITGLMFFILQTVDTFILFNILIFLTSMVSDAFRPANMTAVAYYSEPKNQTRSISLIRLAINAGWAVGPAVGGVVAIRLSYSWLFWLDGLTCILAGIFLLLFLKPVREDEEKDIVEIVPEGTGKTPLKDHSFLAFLLFNVITSLVFFQLLSAVPVYLKSGLGMDEDAIGLILALNGLLIVATEMPLVYALQSRMHSLRVIAMGSFFVAFSFAVFVLGSWKGLAVISMLLLTFGEIFQMPFANAYTMGRAQKSNMGKYLSYYGMSYSLAFILAPIFGLHIAENFGYDTLWYVMTLVGLTGAFGFYFLYRRSIR
jgi:predicted MFS family arabinose efflux permease